MSTPTPTPGEAGAILNHYFAQLAGRAGLRWTDENRADIARAATLLAQADADADSIPPYAPPAPPIRSERVTEVLTRDTAEAEDDPDYRAWRERRYAAGDLDDARRMLRRNGGGAR